MMRPIFLVGYMGCGKTTLGTAVAKVADVDFIDLDDYIEREHGMTVGELFKKYGEPAFREMERRALHDVADMENVIVACGGGTPCFFDNMEYMNKYGRAVWLDASIDRLLSRLSIAKAKRPLIADKSDTELGRFIIEALDKRRPFYSQAESVFPSDLLENQNEIDLTVSRFVKIYSLPLK